MSQTRSPETQRAPVKVPTHAQLGWLRAVFNSFFGVSADFYPRVVVDGRIKSLPTNDIMAEMAEGSSWTSLDAAEIEVALQFARQSLAEVKSQTEYQDQKATRLLAITTFLTAFSGVLFTRFQDSYEIGQLYRLQSFQPYLVKGTYFLFVLFIFTALSGALVIFHATRTRFKYPTSHTAEGQDKDPKSLEFYAALIAVRPRAWVKAWVKEPSAFDTVKKLAVRRDLKARYLHNLVSETYLVAAKTADKLRYLEPGQSLLAGSLRCLFLWLILVGVVTATVPPVRSPSTPTEVRLISVPNIPRPRVQVEMLPSKQVPSNEPAGKLPLKSRQ